MELRPISTEREPLVNLLNSELNMPIEYSGFPKFMYKVGPYQIHRDGVITVPDEDIDERLIKMLQAKHIIEPVYRDKPAGFIVSVRRWNVQNYRNFLFMLSARQYLLNRVGGNFSIPPEVINRIRNVNPGTIPEFIETLYSDDEIKGATFTTSNIIVTGFPELPQYGRLVDLMAFTCFMHAHVKPFAKIAESEKYAMRSWLVSIGMKGKQYEQDRIFFLDGLNGNGSYATDRRSQEHLQELIDERRREFTYL